VPAEGYLRAVLADGVTRFHHRGRVRELLGLPPADAFDFTTPTPPPAFAYLHGPRRPGGRSTGWDQDTDDPSWPKSAAPEWHSRPHMPAGGRGLVPWQSGATALPEPGTAGSSAPEVSAGVAAPPPGARAEPSPLRRSPGADPATVGSAQPENQPAPARVESEMVGDPGTPRPPLAVAPRLLAIAGIDGGRGMSARVDDPPAGAGDLSGAGGAGSDDPVGAGVSFGPGDGRSDTRLAAGLPGVAGAGPDDAAADGAGGAGVTGPPGGVAGPDSLSMGAGEMSTAWNPGGAGSDHPLSGAGIADASHGAGSPAGVEIVDIPGAGRPPPRPGRRAASVVDAGPLAAVGVPERAPVDIWPGEDRTSRPRAARPAPPPEISSEPAPMPPRPPVAEAPQVVVVREARTVAFWERRHLARLRVGVLR
jgi:hypothetical protein